MKTLIMYISNNNYLQWLNEEEEKTTKKLMFYNMNVSAFTRTDLFRFVFKKGVEKKPSLI